MTAEEENDLREACYEVEAVYTFIADKPFIEEVDINAKLSTVTKHVIQFLQSQGLITYIKCDEYAMFSGYVTTEALNSLKESGVNPDEE